MPLEYELSEKLQAIAPVQEEHTAWFGEIVRQAFYPEITGGSGSVPAPQSFIQWQRDIEEEGTVGPEVLVGLRKIHDDLHKAGAELVSSVGASGQKPEARLFDSFATLFEEFLNHLGRFERDFLLEDGGLDSLTGLRTKSVLGKDLEKELERFARQGKQFTVAIIRIDHYEKILSALGEGQIQNHVKLVSDLIKKSMRTFDDAYVYEQDKFVLSLKQSDINGGIAALERVRADLEAEDITFTIEGGPSTLTLSCCVAEPVPGDKVEELLENLNQDLKEAGTEPDTVLQHHEVSPLERYVQTTKE